MNRNYRQVLIAVVTFLGGLYFFLEFILPEKIGNFKFGIYHDQISTGVIVVGTMAIGLGIINILRVHGAIVLRTSRGWGNSLALIIGLFVMLTVGAIDFVDSEKSVSSWKQITELQDFIDKIKEDFEKAGQPGAERIEILSGVLNREMTRSQTGKGFLAPLGGDEHVKVLAAKYLSSSEGAVNSAALLAQAYRKNPPAAAEVSALSSELKNNLKQTAEAAKDLATLNYEQAPAKKASHFLENAFFFPLGAAMFSLLAFYIANAAYRSFRIRSLEALVMMLAAVVVMLGQIPHGPLYVWKGLPMLRLWLLQNVSTPAFRAVYFGAAIAGLAMSVRMWLSLEKSPLSTGDGE